MSIDFRTLSLQDALDLAISIEEEAKERYDEFVRQVGGGRYAGDAADMFRLMAGYEAKHAADLAARRRELFGSAPRRVTKDALDDVEAPDRGQPRVFMSARQAMEVALASEEKAHEFFSDALRHVTDPQVKALFEELRGEEQEHIRLVKQRLEKLPPGPDVEEDEADAPGLRPRVGGSCSCSTGAVRQSGDRARPRHPALLRASRCSSCRCRCRSRCSSWPSRGRSTGTGWRRAARSARIGELLVTAFPFWRVTVEGSAARRAGHLRRGPEPPLGGGRARDRAAAARDEVDWQARRPSGSPGSAGRSTSPATSRWTGPTG